MNYKVVQLAHKHETEAKDIQSVLDEMSANGWVLKTTQFLPWVIEEGDESHEYIGWGYLLLFFEEEVIPG